MKMKWLMALSALVLVISCEIESDIDNAPDEMIVGKWMVQSMEFFGETVSGDGSYLEFKECSATCSGIDYMATDRTSGSFTYVLNESATVLEIVDNTSDGGSYNGSWDILELSDSKFRIVGNTSFGSLKLEMTK